MLTHLFGLAYELLCITSGRYRFQSVINRRLFSGSRLVPNWGPAHGRQQSSPMQRFSNQGTYPPWRGEQSFCISWVPCLSRHPPTTEQVRAEQSRSVTWTCRNIASISAMNATGSFLNLASSPTSLLLRSGPWRRCLLGASPLVLHGAVEDYTNLFRLLKTAWWGRFSSCFTFSFGIFST